MARSSPGVKRMVSVLNFFAEHPGQAFTLTDIVRALKLSRATCHALLTGLVEYGYLYRTSDKSYVIGPALVAIGRIANEHFSPLQVAQPEMRALADQFDAICSAFFRQGSDVVVRGRATSMSHLGYSIPLGARLPLRPPFGAIYYAWSPPAEVERWLGQLSPRPEPDQRADMIRGMAFAREHGFAFGIRTTRASFPPVEPERTIIERPAEFPAAALHEIDADKAYRLAFVLAPVFDRKGKVEFVLGLVGFDRQVSGADVMGMGQALRAACDRISDYITGRALEPAAVAD